MKTEGLGAHDCNLCASRTENHECVVKESYSTHSEFRSDASCLDGCAHS
jgi:hypothetical protein